MTKLDSVVFLPGGGAGDSEVLALKEILEAGGRFRMVTFPGWQSYVYAPFSADALIRAIVSFIETQVPEEPVRIVGLSLGAHLGYASALRAQALGRQVAGFCAIDGLMSGYPWRQGIELLREGQLLALWELARAKLRHSLIRLQRERAPVVRVRNTEADKVRAQVLWLSAARAWTSSIYDARSQLFTASALIRTRPAAVDDGVWKRRCPGIHVFQVRGTHQTLLDQRNIDSLKGALNAATGNWP